MYHSHRGNAINPTYRVNLMKLELVEFLTQHSAFFRRFHQPIIHAWCVLSLVHLGDSADAFQHVRLASQHQSLEGSDGLQIPPSGGPKDTLSQVFDGPVDSLPVNGVPV